MDEKLEQFVSITGCSVAVGRSLLEACGGNLDLAVDMHLEGGASAGGASASPATDPPGPSASGTDATEPSYEELYGVRAPIPQTSGVLIEGDAPPRRVIRSRRLPQTVFDPFQDYSSSYSAAVAMRRPTGAAAGKKERLADLFKPPLDVMFQGTFNEARAAGRSKQKWLLVNLQDSKEFASQVLNRDIWSDHNIKEVIRQHFIFWQIHRITDDGVNFKRLYHVEDFPCVCVIDPRTGEKMHHWSKSTGVTCAEILKLLKDFVDQHPYADDDHFDIPENNKTTEEDGIIADVSEDQQLEAAIRASLQDSAAAPSAVDTSGRRQGATRSPVLVFSDEDSDDCIITSAEEVESDLYTGSAESDVDLANSDKHIGTDLHSDVHSSKLQAKRTLQSSSQEERSLVDTSHPTAPASVMTATNHTTEALSSSTPSLSSPASVATNRKRKLSDIDLDALVPPIKKPSHSHQQEMPTPTAKDHTGVVDLTSQREEEASKSSQTTSKNPRRKSKKPKTKSKSAASLVGDSQASCSPSLEDQLAAGSLTKDRVAQLLIRLPDGSRTQKAFLCDQPISELFDYLRLQGLDMAECEVVTHFPKRCVSQLEHSLSFKQAGLYPQETLFLQ